jgi:hypothetical protein
MVWSFQHFEAADRFNKARSNGHQLMKSSIQREKPKGDGSAEHLPVDRLLTPVDVAAITSLSLETLAQWRSQKRGIPYLKISRNCIRYQQSDLAIWLAARRVCVEVGTK